MNTLILCRSGPFYHQVRPRSRVEPRAKIGAMAAGCGERAADFEARDEFGNADANLHFLRDVVGLQPGSRILEVGSGRGSLLHTLRQEGFDARGVEVKESLIADSRRLYGEL